MSKAAKTAKNIPESFIGINLNKTFKYLFLVKASGDNANVTKGRIAATPSSSNKAPITMAISNLIMLPFCFLSNTYSILFNEFQYRFINQCHLILFFISKHIQTRKNTTYKHRSFSFYTPIKVQ